MIYDAIDNSKSGRLPREELFKFQTDYETWKVSTHDDKTLVSRIGKLLNNNF